MSIKCNESRTILPHIQIVIFIYDIFVYQSGHS